MPQQVAVLELETGARWTYQTLDREIDRAAAWLVEQLGPSSGARVAVLLKNSAEMLILQIAAVRAGAVFVPLNWRLAPAEIALLVKDAAPALLFHDPEFETTARAAAGTQARLIELDGRLETILGETALERPPSEARLSFDAPATLLYTSGTSGRPKGVIVTEANAFFGCVNFMLGNGVSRESVFLCDMPMFHTAGLYAATRTPLLAGGTVLISKGFDAAQTLARLSDPALRVSHYFCVPQMAQRLWEQPAFDPDALSHLRILATGGAPNPPALIERFHRAGIPMSNGFGMSETGSNFGMPVEDIDLVLAKPGSCGLPFVSLDVRIVRDDGSEAAVGETGELCVAGPSVTPGYWNRPDETVKALRNGRFHTGDLARKDADGFYYIVDRKKDMFISGGENVYPAEVEGAISELPDVGEVAVIGVPDERWGEVGRAYVTARPETELAAEQVLTHCRSRLAKFKIPASIVIGRDLPRTASGKIQKHLLRQQAIEEMQ